MGPACDLLGPCRASGFASLLAALAVAATASSPAGFVALCFVAGLSLANFIANQHWMSGIFVPSAVGLANAVTAGWANVGSTAAQLVMPLTYELVLRLDVRITVAWRVTYLLPCVLLITTGLVVIAFPNDLPRGAGVGGRTKTDKSLWKVVRGEVGNYLAWVLALTYGYCYGVELIMDNMATDFF
jgi:MFS transporter, NNP family, nitrate/nitrite transporter